MMIPVRGGLVALALEYDFQALVDAHPDLNRTMEEAWASLLSVVSESWPDWPIEVWSNLKKIEATEPEALPTWRLGYRVTFSGQDASNPDVAAMVAFITQGLGKVVHGDPEVSWAGVIPGWRALWVVDDTQVFRMIADTQTIESSVWLLGHYAGEPEYFAATFEAWPLRHAGLPIERAEADLGWAFSF